MIGAQLALPLFVDDFETIAIPLWEKKVAPRFCCADQFLIVKARPHLVGESQQIAIGEELNWRRRLSILRKHNVDVLICGGFNNCFLPEAEGLGLKVKRGACGLVSEIVERYVDGTLVLHPAQDADNVCRRAKRREMGPYTERNKKAELNNN